MSTKLEDMARDCEAERKSTHALHIALNFSTGLRHLEAHLIPMQPTGRILAKGSL